MRLLAPALVLAAAALCTMTVQAAPANQGDDMDKLLSEKGILTHLDHARQTVSNKTSELVGNAMGFLGVRYKRGGTTAETGFDCSGFVKAIYEKSVGLILPRRAEQQAAATQNIDKKDLQPGDLVFFNTMRRAFSHVGIYVGDGKFIHSPKPGAEVRVESLSVAYWQRRFDGARRVPGSAAPEAQPVFSTQMLGTQPPAPQTQPETQAAPARPTVQSQLQSMLQQEQYRN